MIRIFKAASCAFGAAVVAAGLLAWPGAALASGGGGPLWVSKTTPASGTTGGSCADPGWNTISGAIQGAPPGATINVCAGVYTEQLQITTSMNIVGHGKVVVHLPAGPDVVPGSTACDEASDGVEGANADQDGVSICGAITVTLKDLRIYAAWPTATCDDNLYGILIGGGATVNFTDSAVTAAGAVPLNGCQGGVGIQDGMAWTTPNQVGHLTMTDSTVGGYQKNGLTIDGQGSTATITGSTVRGIGPTTQIAQNGIQVSNGAQATITKSSISGNECNYPSVCGPNGLTQYGGTGVLFYGAAAGSSVRDSTISDNDAGVYYLANPSAKAPKHSQVLISDDKITRNRYQGVQLDQGRATVSHCTISSGNVGIQVLQYNGQTFGSHSVATHDTIKLVSVASVQVLSDRSATGDLPGTFTLTYSDFAGGAIRDNSKNLPIIRSHNIT